MGSLPHRKSTFQEENSMCKGNESMKEHEELNIKFYK